MIYKNIEEDKVMRPTNTHTTKNQPIFVFSAPATPNGDLHLGHLSGPYLGADVLVRFLRSTGQEAYHLSGSDDYQSYVARLARQKRTTPQIIAAHYAAEIKNTLEMMNIHLDQYTVTSRNVSYAKGMQTFFSRLTVNGVERVRDTSLFDSQTHQYLYEGDVRGNCPTCDSSTGGNMCEECGEPNSCVELIKPYSQLSNLPPQHNTIERYAIDLNNFKNVVYQHHKQGKISLRLQQLAKKIFARKNSSIALTHPAAWGIPPLELVEGQQVIWGWVEVAYGFLYGIGELAQHLKRPWHADQPQNDWKIIHFFGYDNSFYHTILFPILYHLAFPKWQCDIDYNVNEFYLLNGRKFSTSRRHAIWGKDILTSDNVDAIRYYLALTRGEQKRTNFTLKNFHQCIDETLLGQWQHWLTNLGKRIQDAFASRAPAPIANSWTPRQIAYFNSLEHHLKTITRYYSAKDFSLNQVANELNSLVKNALIFADAHRYIHISNEYQTAIALELAAAQLLAKVTAPLMPRFSAQLSKSLGILATNCWPNAIELLTTGNPIDLAKQIFFTNKSTKVNKY